MACRHNPSKEFLALTWRRIPKTERPRNIVPGKSESDAKTHRTSKALRAKIYEDAGAMLCADSPECERRFGFYDLAVHFKQRVRKKIDRTVQGFGIDHQVTTLR